MQTAIHLVALNADVVIPFSVSICFAEADDGGDIWDTCMSLYSARASPANISVTGILGMAEVSSGHKRSLLK